jgi:methionyl-tRNA formyltransferase
MNIVFAGTPEFAASALDSLWRAGHAVKLVLTQPDRPAGRGLKPRFSAVKRAALEFGIAVLQPATLRDESLGDAILALQPDVMVVAAYGLMVPQAVLEIPRLGAINIHASLLPRWRGAAPIQRAILAGDAATGITIMQMDAGLDTGSILLQEPVAIAACDTAQSLHDKLAVSGGRLIVEALSRSPVAHPQDAANATYAHKIEKREARIVWTENAVDIERKVRAFNPHPGASTAIGAIDVKIWRTQVEPGIAGRPGAVCESDASGIVVACGRDGLRILELQRAGGKRLPVSAFIAGFEVPRGAFFGDQ